MTAFQHSARFALAACGALALGLASAAQAEDAAPLPGAERAAIDFSDPSTPLQTPASAGVGVTMREAGASRFAGIGPTGESGRVPNAYEVAVTADGDAIGSPVDLSFAQRARLTADQNGDRRGQGSEVRVGQGLESNDTSSEPRWYVFAASDDEAVTWNPGQRTEFGTSGSSFSMQDRVEIGDAQVGVTYERNGVQASVAYVERDVSATVGQQSRSREENFAGVTLTMRR